jgi:hypothetical protein
MSRASWGAHSHSAYVYSDVSESEGTQGEDIKGAEYADRSVDGSQSGQSLQGLFNDHDSGSIQGPSFFRALDNEVSVNPVQWALGPLAMICTNHVDLKVCASEICNRVYAKMVPGYAKVVSSAKAVSSAVKPLLGLLCCTGRFTHLSGC